MEYTLEDIKTMGVKFKKTIVSYELGNLDIKKSGYNKFSDYKYMELEDFLPHLRSLLLKYRLCYEFSMDKENQIALLNLKDCDSETNLVFTMPYEIPEIKATNLMQKVGGAASYCLRYLLMIAFGIAESDMLDSQHVDNYVDKNKNTKPIDSTKPNDSTHALVESANVDNFINDKQQKLLFATMKDLGSSEAKKACLTYCIKLLMEAKKVNYDLSNISTKTILKKDFSIILDQIKSAVEKKKKQETPEIPK